VRKTKKKSRRTLVWSAPFPRVLGDASCCLLLVSAQYSAGRGAIASLFDLPHSVLSNFLSLERAIRISSSNLAVERQAVC
jgi:hypothetical protein